MLHILIRLRNKFRSWWHTCKAEGIAEDHIWALSFVAIVIGVCFFVAYDQYRWQCSQKENAIGQNAFDAVVAKRKQKEALAKKLVPAKPETPVKTVEYTIEMKRVLRIEGQKTLGACFFFKECREGILVTDETYKKYEVGDRFAMQQ